MPADQGLVKHPHVKSSWRTVRLEMPDGILETVLVIETDLVLNTDDPQHDAAAFNSMVQAVRDYMAAHDSVDRATIYPLASE